MSAMYQAQPFQRNMGPASFPAQTADNIKGNVDFNKLESEISIC